MGRVLLSEMIGRTYGKWTVLGVGNPATKDRHKHVTCRCECGNVRIIRASRVADGQSTACISCTNRMNVGRRKDRQRPAA